MESIINHVASQCGTHRHSITCYQTDGVVSQNLSELDASARKVAAYLRGLGVQAGDRIGIIARNCIEWVLLDLAAIKLKVTTAGFEAGKFPPDRDLLDGYGLKLVFTDQPAALEQVMDIRSVSAAISAANGEAPSVSAAWAPEETTTIKFTSGSTGKPKGLAATVGSIDSSLHAVQSMFRHHDGDRLFVFLPLSLLQQRYWIYSALHFGHDVVLSTYELALYAMRREQPTVIMGVPAFFDAVRRQIEVLAREMAEDADDSVAADDMDELRRRAARQVLGGRVRYLWTGSAPADPATLRFFEDCGVPIYEGYGMNETCIVTKNHPGAHRVGSVGKVVPGKELRIGPDSVVIVSSRWPVNTRYLFCAPGESEKIFLPNGDVRTGDIGHIDADGFLYITGRVDDIVVLGNGKNIMVRRIEEQLKASPAIENCVLYGSGRPYLIAIISTADGGSGEEAISRHVNSINSGLDKDERIGRFLLSPEHFSIENGLLTSQYKPKRKEIFNRFRTEIEAVYGVPK